MAGKDQQGGEVKLSCRNLWKIYGERPGSFLASLGSGAVDAAALATTVRATGHIAAVCDVSFDVLAGEIFVIMGLSGSGKSTVVRCLSRLRSEEHTSDLQSLMRTSSAVFRSTKQTLTPWTAPDKKLTRLQAIPEVPDAIPNTTMK